MNIELPCPTCELLQPASRDEDGLADIDDLVPCEGSQTKHYLCRSCRIECCDCGVWTCEEHSGKRPYAAKWPDGHECTICSTCLAEPVDYPDAAELLSGHGSEVEQD